MLVVPEMRMILGLRRNSQASATCPGGDAKVFCCFRERSGSLGQWCFRGEWPGRKRPPRQIRDAMLGAVIDYRIVVALEGDCSDFARTRWVRCAGFLDLRERDVRRADVPIFPSARNAARAPTLSANGTFGSGRCNGRARCARVSNRRRLPSQKRRKLAALPSEKILSGAVFSTPPLVVTTTLAAPGRRVASIRSVLLRPGLERGTDREALAPLPSRRSRDDQGRC